MDVQGAGSAHGAYGSSGVAGARIHPTRTGPC